MTVVDASNSYQRVLIGRAPTQEELAESAAVEAEEEEIRGDGTRG